MARNMYSIKGRDPAPACSHTSYSYPSKQRNYKTSSIRAHQMIFQQTQRLGKPKDAVCTSRAPRLSTQMLQDGSRIRCCFQQTDSIPARILANCNRTDRKPLLSDRSSLGLDLLPTYLQGIILWAAALRPWVRHIGRVLSQHAWKFGFQDNMNLAPRWGS